MLPLKVGAKYRTNRGEIITLIKTEKCNSHSLWSEEVRYYFEIDELRAPGTSCEIVEELIQGEVALDGIRPSSLTHEEMMQRLNTLEDTL